MRIIGPVRTELEFHGNTRGNPEREVNTKEFAPEAGHVFVNFFTSHDIDQFHCNKHERKSQRKWNKQEVVHRGGCKLQA